MRVARCWLAGHRVHDLPAETAELRGPLVVLSETREADSLDVLGREGYAPSLTARGPRLLKCRLPLGWLLLQPLADQASVFFLAKSSLEPRLIRHAVLARETSDAGVASCALVPINLACVDPSLVLSVAGRSLQPNPKVTRPVIDCLATLLTGERDSECFRRERGAQFEQCRSVEDLGERLKHVTLRWPAWLADPLPDRRGVEVGAGSGLSDRQLGVHQGTHEGLGPMIAGRFRASNRLMGCAHAVPLVAERPDGQPCWEGAAFDKPHHLLCGVHAATGKELPIAVSPNERTLPRPARFG